MGVKKELEAAKKSIDDALKTYEAKKKKVEPELKKLKDALKAVTALVDKAPFDAVKAKALLTQAAGAANETEKAAGAE